MARLIINSCDSFGENINQKMIVKKISTPNNTVIYQYDNRYGIGTIEISKKWTKILKFGDVKSSLLLTFDKKTKFLYETNYLKKEFSVKCINYIYSKNRLTTSYILYDNNIEINRLKIEIIECV